MTDAEKLKLCRGCRDNFYNTSGANIALGGHCWSLKTAKPLERTMIGIWQNPPYTWRPQQTLSCHRPEDMAWINRDDVRLRENQ